VGFQLSYGAVISIMLFSKPIAQLIPIKNKIVWGIWNLCAVSISAQLLTLPLILYHFHQVPTLFLITNIVAVPLSGIILYVELVLLILSFISPIALFVGKTISLLLWIMNAFIRIVNNIPMSVISGIEISLIQSMLLYLVLISSIVWVVDSRRKWFIYGLVLLFVFFGLNSSDVVTKQHQHKLVVYNISKHTAIDIMDGINCTFIGDSMVNKDQSLYNFHIKPCRTLYRTQVVDTLPSIAVYDNFIQFNNKKVMVLDKPLPHNLQPKQKIKVDVVVITKNPKMYVTQLVQYFDCNQLVFDATNPFWKVNYWKQDAQKLHIPYYDIREQGAFVMDLDK
jgi:competence protein ComEC